jgi:hypothetical protein
MNITRGFQMNNSDKATGCSMKRIDFMALCGEFLIDPDLALENDYIREALIEKDYEAVKYLLKTEF